MVYYEVRTGNKIRFSSLSITECEQHARKVYKETGEIPEIFEIDR